MKSKVFIRDPKVLKHASVIAVMIPMTMLLLICGLSSPSYGQGAPDTIVQFSDRTLAIMVRVQLSEDNIDELKRRPEAEVLKIPKAELIHLTHLYANVTRVEDEGLPLITDLTGLEHATNLRELFLHSNRISDLTPLSELTALEVLELNANRIRDITPLAHLTALETLYLWRNNIIDITPLSELTALETLELSSNSNLRDITPLAHLTALETLELSDNDIRDLTPLSELTELKELSLRGNDISDLTPLSELTELKELSLSGNDISDLTPLSELIALEWLWLRDNPIGDWELRDWDVLRQLKAQDPYLSTLDVSIPPLPPPATTETPATTSTKIHISPSPVVSPAVGEQLQLNLNIANGEAVAGYQATVKFDDTALRYVSSANGDYLPAGAFFVESKVTGNLVQLNATSLAGETDGSGTLATLTFEVIAAKASILTLSDVLLTDSAGEPSVPQVENAEITEPTGLKGDVNGDGIVNIQDLVLVAGQLGETGTNSADVNADGVVNIQDLVLVAGALGTSAAAPSLHLQTLEILTAADVKQWLSQTQGLDLTDTMSQRGILFLQQLFVALTPKETALLPNYPNPFNPETWIPYQLSKPADVAVTIYAANGRIIRHLALGHQSAGIYQTRSRAAYWDGRNAFGEPVASGLYFYTLTTGDFTATRKMLIRK